MTTRIKQYKDVQTSLRGSAFRRASHDGRTVMLRAIATGGPLRREPRSISRTPGGRPAGPVDSRARVAQARNLHLPD
ncbi:hypothetical protein [Aquisphaera insulae]|uniref:hypothetical protein n=1 Tax=Aquisphaera insulae TaxID=2712864 RepID=UPI0013EB19A1|nr:hypothetical protein [Aquisphaera insulae]